jgi:hypothetical protein
MNCEAGKKLPTPRPEPKHAPTKAPAKKKAPARKEGGYREAEKRYGGSTRNPKDA